MISSLYGLKNTEMRIENANYLAGLPKVKKVMSSRINDDKQVDCSCNVK